MKVAYGGSANWSNVWSRSLRLFSWECIDTPFTSHRKNIGWKRKNIYQKEKYIHQLWELTSSGHHHPPILPLFVCNVVPPLAHFLFSLHSHFCTFKLPAKQDIGSVIRYTGAMCRFSNVLAFPCLCHVWKVTHLFLVYNLKERWSCVPCVLVWWSP